MNNELIIKWLNDNAKVVNLKQLALKIGASDTYLHRVKEGRFAIKEEMKNKLIEAIRDMQL